MKIRVHVFVSGRVQGVFFRGFTSETAKRNKITGWVRNIKDGRVEACLKERGRGLSALLKNLKKVLPMQSLMD